MRNYLTDAEVTVWTPPELGRDGEVFGRPSEGADLDINKSLQMISTSEHIRQPAGSFSLTLDPRPVRDGLSWSQIIPKQSVVRIRQRRSGHDADLTNTMIGLVRENDAENPYDQAAPARSNRISGQAASSLLLNHRVYYFPMSAPSVEAQRYDVETYTAAIFDKALFEDALNKPPQEAIERLFKKYIDAIDLRVANFQNANGRGTRLVRFDKANARMFDDDARYSVPVPPFYSGPIWMILQQFVDPTFQEFFTTTSPTADEVLVHFRPPPWARVQFDATTSVPGVTKLMSSGVSRARSLGLFKLDAPGLVTHTIEPEDLRGELVNTNLDDTYSAYWVLPPTTPETDMPFKASLPPIIIDDEGDPSYVGRHGLKTLEVQMHYMPDTAGFIDAARRWQENLADWHRFNPLLWSGTVRALARASFRIGSRLVVKRPPGADYPLREYYVVGVGRTHDLQTGAFDASLNVIRGFDLTEADL